MSQDSSGRADRIPGSFRDPSGFLFKVDGVVYRQVNAPYAESWAKLHDSGLYQALIDKGLLVAHEEVSLRLPESEAPPALKVIRPAQVPFVSWPYEWSFGQLKTAAKLTLQLQKIALDKGMVLRDASAYNVQFLGCKPIFIDTLSFGPYVEGEPWVAYQQFCRHFLAPLALMAKVDVGLGQLLRVHLDGVPLDLASKLLPFSTKLSFGLLTHLHLHARSSRRWADSGAEPAATPAKAPSGVSRTAMLGLIDSLESAIEALDWAPAGTEWGDYYDKTNYTADAHTFKKQLVARFLEQAGKPSTVWDLGANTGVFSRIAADSGARVMSFDIDPAAVERNFREGAAKSEAKILPLLQDLTNPSAGIGWDNDERASLPMRGPAGAILGLALVHHLAISNNVPLDRIARFFARCGRFAIVEWVPKSDSQVKRLLATREDIFPTYTEEGFEAAFATAFHQRAKERITGSERTLYLWEAR